MKNIKTKLEAIESQKAVNPKKVVILYCPPLTRQKFNKDKLLAPISRVIGWEKDFIRNQKSWNHFENSESRFVLKSLLGIRQNYGSQVFIHAGFGAFKRILVEQNYDAIFLVAHHIQRPSVSKIEFSNGGVPTQKVFDFIKKIAAKKQIPSIVFFVCEADHLGKKILQEVDFQNSVSMASWKMPLKESAQFMEIWLSALDGVNTLSDAYLTAIDEIKHRIS